MITFKKLNTWGGLGNQMWAVASTYGIAQENHHDVCLPLWNYQQYFKNEPFYTDIDKALDFHDYEYINAEYRKIELDSRLDYNLIGYFQSWKYFKDNLHQIRHIFDPALVVNDQYTDYVSIHVRRGDYLNLQHIHPVLPMVYYRKAMAQFPGSQFMIFSDDIEWCKDHFKGERYTYVVNHDRAIYDLLFMSGCKAHIIANSSFSWWSAFLSGNPTVAPKIWALNESPESYKDRLLPEWVGLDYEN